MSRAKQCDSCDALFKIERGTVWFSSYHVSTDNEGSGYGYEADLCPACSAKFLASMKHDYRADERPETLTACTDRKAMNALYAPRARFDFATPMSAAMRVRVSNCPARYCSLTKLGNVSASWKSSAATHRRWRSSRSGVISINVRKSENIEWT
jgi:hypothetical protein